MRRLEELELVDEFIKELEIQKEGFYERTIAWVEEKEMTPFERKAR